VFFLAALAWIFFRASTVKAAIVIAKKFVIAIPEYIYNFFTKPNFLWLEELLFNRTLAFVWFDLLILSVYQRPKVIAITIISPNKNP